MANVPNVIVRLCRGPRHNPIQCSQGSYLNVSRHYLAILAVSRTFLPGANVWGETLLARVLGGFCPNSYGKVPKPPCAQTKDGGHPAVFVWS